MTLSTFSMELPITDIIDSPSMQSMNSLHSIDEHTPLDHFEDDLNIPTALFGVAIIRYGGPTDYRFHHHPGNDHHPGSVFISVSVVLMNILH